VLLTPAAHIRQDSSGRIVAGEDFGGGGSGVPQTIGQCVLEAMRRVVPALADVEIEHITVGHRPTPGDGIRVAGISETVRGLYIAVMHSAIILARLVGRLAAAEILDDLRIPRFVPYRPARFC